GDPLPRPPGVGRPGRDPGAGGAGWGRGPDRPHAGPGRTPRVRRWPGAGCRRGGVTGPSARASSPPAARWSRPVGRLTPAGTPDLIAAFNNHLALVFRAEQVDARTGRDRP